MLQQKTLINWGISVAGATCSLSSNNLLLTGVTVLPDTDNQVRVQPRIFQ